MRARQTYLQWFEPTRAWRFRRAVPDHLRGVIGKREITQTLQAKDRAEAERLVRPLIDETDRVIALAEAGNWPPIEDDHIEAIAEGWWRVFQLDRSRQIRNADGGLTWPNGRTYLDDIDSKAWALASDDDLSRSVRQFLTGPREWRNPLAPDKLRDQVETYLADPRRSAQLFRNADAMGRLLRHCRILHHHAAGDYLGQVDDRHDPINRILDMIDGLQVDPRQILAAIEGRTGLPQATPSVGPPQFAQGIFPPMSLGAVAAEDGLDLISRWARERSPEPKTIYQTRRHAIKLVAFIGHDDATRVTPENLIGWKEDLAGKGLTAATINSHLNTIKAPLAWAHRNRKIPMNPGVGIFYDRKDESAPKREGYDDDQARLILAAARDEDEPHRRWIPWLCAFTGTRLDEVAGADVRDIDRVGTRWVFSVRTLHRGKAGSVKNPGSARKIPLHPVLLREGFLDYVKSLPNPGPLFPSLTPDRFGRRSGTATKRIGYWLRQVEETTGVLLVEEPRFAPNHSWRHRFKSETRRVGISEETSDALTGHRQGKVSRSYGEYYIDAVLGPAIESMLSPFDIKLIQGDACQPSKAA